MIHSLHSTDDFASMQLVRTGTWIRFVGKITFLCLLLSIIAMVFVPWQQTARGIGTVVVKEATSNKTNCWCDWHRLPKTAFLKSTLK